MMNDLFLTILNMSINASWLILIVIVLRFLFNKTPKSFIGLVYYLVGFKLISNFTIESFFSLIPSKNTIPLNITVVHNPTIESGFEMVNESINPILMDSSLTMVPSLEVSWLDVMVNLASIVWIVGIVFMLMYNMVSYFSLKRKVSASISYMDQIYFCDDINTPFILGYIHPKIYLPSNIESSYVSHILSHEKEHLKHFDHIKKLIGILILSMHWFNPLVWVAYILFCKDIEVACDERVTYAMREKDRIAYCQTLVNMSSISNVFACPLAFAEVGVKNRVKSIMNYRRPAFWVILLSVCVCIFLGLGFLSTPMNNSILSIEERLRGDYSTFFDDVQSIRVSNGTYSYTSVFEEDNKAIINALKNLKIGNTPVNENRSTDRDKTHRIVLNGERYIYFDDAFKTVWIKDPINATYSYRIKNTKQVKEIFAPLYVDENKYTSYIDGFISENVDGDEILVTPMKSTSNIQYAIKMDLTEEMLRTLKKNHFVRITYNGTLKEGNPIVIDDVSGLYLLNSTKVTSNEEEIRALGKENIANEIHRIVEEYNQQLKDNLYRDQDLYIINQYAFIHVYYDEEESAKICKERGYEGQAIAIIEKYLGSNILNPMKEEGYGYHIYRIKTINGEEILEVSNSGGVIY